MLFRSNDWLTYVLTRFLLATRRLEWDRNLEEYLPKTRADLLSSDHMVIVDGGVAERFGNRPLISQSHEHSLPRAESIGLAGSLKNER